MVFLGSIVNAIGVILGSLIGIVFKKWIKEELGEMIFSGIALVILYMGITGAIVEMDATILIFSMVFGASIGYLLNIDAKITQFADKVNERFNGKSQDQTFAKSFITGCVLYCVGAMTLVGALESGLYLSHETLYAKTVLDFISSIIIASTMGIGVMFSAIIVLLYQGSISLFASLIQPYLAETVISQISVVGSLLVIALGLNLLKATNIKIANLIPAMFMPILFNMFL